TGICRCWPSLPGGDALTVRRFQSEDDIGAGADVTVITALLQQPIEVDRPIAGPILDENESWQEVVGGFAQEWHQREMFGPLDVDLERIDRGNACVRQDRAQRPAPHGCRPGSIVRV